MNATDGTKLSHFVFDSIKIEYFDLMEDNQYLLVGGSRLSSIADFIPFLAIVNRLLGTVVWSSE